MSEATKIIEVREWKTAIMDRREVKSLSKYYSLLNLQELLNEASTLISELNFSEVNKDIEFRVVELVKEFKNRIENNKMYSSALEQISMTLENNLKYLLA